MDIQNIDPYPPITTRYYNHEYDIVSNVLENRDRLKKIEFWNELKKTSFRFVPELDVPNPPDVPFWTYPYLMSDTGLCLHRTDVNDFDLVHLSGLFIQCLDLSNTKVTNEGMQYLSQLPLVYLSLEETKVTDDGMKYLADIKTLRFLILSETGVTNEGVSMLSQLHDLEFLDLMSTNVTDMSISDIARNCLKLKNLYLAGTDIDGSSFVYFSKSAPLEYIDCSGKRLDNKAIKYLADLDNIKGIEFAFTNVGDDELMYLVNNPSIQHIGVEMSHVTDEGVKTFFQKRRELFGEERKVFIRIGMGYNCP